MSRKNNLLVHQLNQRMAPFDLASKVVRPEKGWINNIRVSLNMTMAQLAKRLKMTVQGVSKIEDREANNSISLGSLKEVADALDMKLVYGFVPKNGSIEDLIDERAQQLAEKIIYRTHQNMVLENQAVDSDFLQQMVQEAATEYKRTIPKTLWD